MLTLIQDLRFSWRVLRRSPGFAAVAVLSIGLGIGANTAIFSLINAFILRLLPAPDPEQLVFVERATPRGAVETDFPYEACLQLREHNRTLAGSFTFDDTNISVTIDGQAEMVPAEFDDPSIFPLLGAHPQLGRMFTDSDDRTGAPPVLVISYAFWTKRFARDRSVVGKNVTLKRIPFTISGVMPPEFLGRRTAGRSPDLWIPMAWQPQLRLKDHDTVEMLARLKPDASAGKAREDLNAIYQQYLKTAPGLHPSNESIYLESAAHGVQRKRLANELRLLMIAVGLLLLIACTNVAGLLLARSASRQREIAVRVSLGATRWRLIRQLLAESFIIAMGGGLCGLFIAWWGSSALLTALGFDPIEYKPDRMVLAFTALVSLATSLVFGLIPAIRSASMGYRPAAAMRRSGLRTPGRLPALGNVLVVAQLAMSLVLVMGAGLLTRSLLKLIRADVGFERHHVLVAAATPTFLGYEGVRELRLYETLLERIDAVPGVESATLSRFRLFAGRWPRPFTTSTQLATDASPKAFCHPIGPRFFETMRIPVLEGREFTRADTERAPRVAVINESVARSKFPNENPIGRSIRFDEGDPYAIVGVVKSVKQISMREDPPRMAIYIPYTQTPPALLGQINFEVRTSGSPKAITAALRQAVRSVDPDLALTGIETQGETIADRMNEERSLARLVSLFGGLALLLATVGLYGTISYALAHRTSEIGIRMAIGASRSDVVHMVLRETLLLVLAGFALGVPAALAGSRVIAGRLFGVTAADPATFAFAAGAMAVVAVAAAFGPASRAARVDPLVALRCE